SQPISNTHISSTTPDRIARAASQPPCGTEPALPYGAMRKAAAKRKPLVGTPFLVAGLAALVSSGCLFSPRIDSLDAGLGGDDTLPNPDASGSADGDVPRKDFGTDDTGPTHDRTAAAPDRPNADRPAPDGGPDAQPDAPPVDQPGADQP